ncbi:MAG TPA: hypothetical protein VNO30_46865 [Kofleriaceae bacterium]|nr:hypothetical protein [Kofleriaceae bacterium]
MKREGGGVVRGLVLGIALAALMASCVVRQLVGPRLTGTCEGACAHYLSCKHSSERGDRERCHAECPEVFGDRESLMTFESLACADAIEYVDGTQPQVAKPK